jgi:proline dehydrogenase
MPLNFEDTAIAFAPKTNLELKKAQWLFRAIGQPSLTRVGIALTQWALRWHLPVNGLIKATIFKQFCGGETLEEADKAALHLNEYGVHAIMDYGVEGKSNETEFEKTTQTFLNTLQFSGNKHYIPFVSLKITGFARFELLEKIQSGAPLTDQEKAELARVEERVDRICALASSLNKMILIDAEESWIQDPVDSITDAMMARYNKNKTTVFNTFQLYRHDRLAFMKTSHEKALQNGYRLGAKLVRGAYMEKERERASQMGYPSPIQPNKAATDADYDAAVLYGLKHPDTITLFVGTHNEQSNQIAADFILQQQLKPTEAPVYFSQLYGMSDNLSFNLGKSGFKVSKYLPYGPVADVIPYLMRRAQENTSVSGQTGRELSLINRELKRRSSAK